MEWSIQDIARIAGTTSRTLRHYGDLELLKPSRIGANGYRYYNQDGLLRLQRILLLRELGLGLSAIAEVVRGDQETSSALGSHLRWLEQERARIDRQIESVRTTLRKTEKGEPLMAEEVLDGFDHTRYKDEVIQRWGEKSYQESDRWWRSLSDTEKEEFQQRPITIAKGFAEALAAKESTTGKKAQALTQLHFEWLSTTKAPTKSYFIRLGQLYVDDPRFTDYYDKHGTGTAKFVRDAMRFYAEQHLSD